MSTANQVPETYGLSGDDAWELLRRTGRRRLLVDAAKRLRVADGFSHVRSLAFMTALVLVQAVIGLVGIATLSSKSSISNAIFSTIQRAVPGPAGRSLTAVISHTHSTANQHRYLPIFLGLFGAIATGTAAMGQLERALNRIYGIERDRPTLQKYGRALCFALSIGLLAAAALICFTVGREIFSTTGNSTAGVVWVIVRWPLGLALSTVAITALFKWSPRRRQPRLSWLAYGSGISIVLWAMSSLGLDLFFRLSSSFGQTYGPLAGTVALLFWCFLSSLSLLIGAAVTAQLEAVRAHSSATQDPEKVEHDLDLAPAGTR